MKHSAHKAIGLAALTLALAGFVFTSSAQAGGAACAASAKSSTKTASASGCEAHKASASLASADGCAAHKSSAALAGADGCTAAKSANFASTCAKLQACSVDMKMEKATTKDIDFYFKEKEMDGVALKGVKLPAFYATNLDGKQVSSKDLKGKPTMLVLLATHCGHSYNTLPILTAAAEEYGPKGVRVVGLVVGSTPETAKTWFAENGAGHEIWVTRDATVADKLQSHLVPTYVLVDAKGNVKTKLVGFKKDTEIKESMPVLLVQSTTTRETPRG